MSASQQPFSADTDVGRTELRPTNARQESARYDDNHTYTGGHAPNGSHRTKWFDSEGEVCGDNAHTNTALFDLNADFPHPTGYMQSGVSENQRAEQAVFGISIAFNVLDGAGAIPTYLSESTIRESARHVDVDPYDVRSLGGHAFLGLVAIVHELDLSDDEKLGLVTNDDSLVRDNLLAGINKYHTEMSSQSRSALVRELLTHVTGVGE